MNTSPAVIPVSVVITTKNEEARLARCLGALSRFGEIWVVDSQSEDQTCEIAVQLGAHVVSYRWDGRYPKKRQWCLEHLSLQYPYVFFVDADEVVPPALADEISKLSWDCAGYFVQGQYVFEGCVLQHGLRNNKLVLFDVAKVEFPVVDDLDLPGMGEMEGHYQPVLKFGFEKEMLGQIRTPLLHEAYEDAQSWEARHQRYAVWEAAMIARNAFPKDPVLWRQLLKTFFRQLPLRAVAAFLHCYIFKGGFLDGGPGYRFAQLRARYYKMVRQALLSNANTAQGHGNAFARAKPERL